MKKIKWYELIAFVVITELIGMLSSVLSGNIKQTYTSFTKPLLSPPGWVFGVVWPILFLLMGIAIYMIYQTPQTLERKTATTLYWVQLFVNFIWSIIFFRFGLYWLSVIVIIILDILVLLTMISFFKIKKSAGYLLIPYLLWILFATYLTIGIAMLN